MKGGEEVTIETKHNIKVEQLSGLDEVADKLEQAAKTLREVNASIAAMPPQSVKVSLELK